MAQLLNAVFSSIKKQDVPTFRRLLPKLKVKELEPENSIKLMDILVKVILDNSNPGNKRTFLKEALTEWTRYYTAGMHVIGEMLRSNIVEDEVIVDVTRALGYHYRDFITALAGYSDSAPNMRAVERMNRLTGLQTPEEYESILEFLRPRIKEGEEPAKINTYLYHFIEAQYRKVSNVAPTPTYLIEKENVKWSDEKGENDPTSIPFVLPSAEEAVDLLLKNMAPLLDNNEDEIRKISYELRKLYTQEGSDRIRIRLLQPIYHSHFGLDVVKDVERFRQWGPANPYVIADGALDPQSSRMLTCMRYVNEDEFEYYHLPKDVDDYEPFDWFKGYCERCDKRIRWYHYARRMPIEDGGWLGCYCSWKCVRDDLASEGEIADVVSPFPMRLLLVKLFKAQIEKYGIYDRPIDENDADDRERTFDPLVEELVLAALDKEEEKDA